MGAKPVQKLSKHSELVKPGWSVHGSYIRCFTCVRHSLVVLDPIGMPQGEDQVRELAPLEFGDEPLVLFVGELAGIVFEDGLGSLAAGCVKEHNRCDIVPVRLGDAGYLLGQDPHGDAVVPGTKPEIDQLPRATLDIFGSGTVIQYE